MKKQTAIRLGVSLLVAALLTAAAGLGWLRVPDNSLSDALYQQQSLATGDIAVVGIDTASLEAIGPIQSWTRDLYALAIEQLNSDPDCRPIAIGLDVIFTGESDPELDDWLAEAAEAYGNVIVGVAAEFDTVPVFEDGELVEVRRNTIVDFYEPYEALRAVTRQGHINGELDADGVLRHMRRALTLPDGRVVPAFHQLLYESWAAYWGEEPGAPPVDNRGYFYIPYQLEPLGFDESLSFVDLIMGNIPPEYFAERVVLIGPYTAGLSDYHIPSISHDSPMYGVEIQANILQSFISGVYKSELPDAPQLALLAVLCLFCLWFFWDRKLRWATAVWLLLAGGSLLASWLLYEAGFVTHALWIPLCVSVIYIVTVAINYIRAALEKRRVTNTFRRYVAPEVVAEILREDKDALALGGKLVDIAVLFVDIRGFTPLSELLSPPEVVDILNRYLTLTSSAVMANKGTLDKFIGDATMAFWGAPLPQEDKTFNAVKAALDMVEGSRELSRELEARCGRTVSFGIGVNVGPAVVGNIGADMRMDYTAIGDTVNTAARLESNAPAGQILVSRAVADELEGRVRFSSLGTGIKLKGKAEGFEVLRVEGLVADSPDEPAKIKTNGDETP